MNRIREPDSALEAGVAVGRRSATERGTRELEHQLEPFIPMVDPSPRAVVRFLNAYALARIAVATLPDKPGVDPLARWTVLELRWPGLAQRLRAEPGLLDRWHHHGPVDADPHATLVRSQAFLTVVLHHDQSPALTSHEVIRCQGVPATPPS